MQATTYDYMYLLASDILPYSNVTGQCTCILCLPVKPATQVQILAGTGWNIFALLYITHFYCFAVEAGFYSKVVECLP